MMSKLFTLYRSVNKRIGFKLMAAIFIVAIIFIPTTSYISYQYTYDDFQQSANDRVHRMVEMVKYNASMAAYLADNELATEIVSSLNNNPEIRGVRFRIGEDVLILGGDIPQATSSIVEILTPPFSDDQIGQLELLINYSYINQQARDKGISLVLWQSFLLMAILVCVYVIFRHVISRPLRQLLEQIRNVPVDGVQSNKGIHVSSDDEIGFLAENTNNLMSRIAGFYRSEAEQNAQIYKLERQFRIIFECSHAGIALLNEGNQVYLANQSFKTTLQYANTDQEWTYLPDFFDDKAEFELLLNRVREQSQSLFQDFRLKEDPDTWLRVLFSHVDHKHSGELEQFVELVVYDISDRAKKEKAFVYNATHDALTGIYNRRGGEIRFRDMNEVAKEQGSHLVMIWLDLNDFKIVNDEHGHEAGDIVLKELSSRLRSISRPDDIVARWGGDEFVVAINLENLDVLPNILSDMEMAFVNAIEISDDLSVVVGASIGVSTSFKTGYDVEKLLIRADQMMYRVKRDGKNGFLIDGIQS